MNPVLPHRQALRATQQQQSTANTVARSVDTNPLARWLREAAQDQARDAAELARERSRLERAVARFAAD